LKFQQLIGLSGVDPDERPSARFCYHLLELPMLVASFWVAAIWYTSSQDPDFEYHHLNDLALWGLFTLETLLLTSLVRDKVHYLRSNWLNLVIILFGIPVLWGLSSYFGALRMLRLLLLVTLILHVGTSLKQLFARNSLLPTLVGSGIIVLMAGFMVATIDPAINSVGEGVWWAWVTVTTVGYGDIVPTSPVGRAFGGVLILIGLGLFSLITASLTASLVFQQEEEPESAESQSLEKIDLLQQDVQRLHQKLDQLLAHRDKKDS